MATLAVHAAAAYEFVSVGDGETITIGDGVANSDQSELSAAAGSTIVLPAPDTSGGTVFVSTRIILTGEGTVTLAAPEGEFSSEVVGMIGGISAADTVTLHVSAASVTALKVGRTRGERDINYPVADIANVTFANPDGVFGLRESVTVKKVPAIYTINPAGDTRLALLGTNPLRLSDSLVLTNFDVVAMSYGSIPATCTVRVAPGRSLYLKPCNMQPSFSGTIYSNNWFWAGVQTMSGTYPVVLEGKGARVVCRNNQNLRLLANISGKGEILIRPDGTTVNIKTFYHDMTYTSSYNATVTLPVDTTAEPAPDDSWKAKVSHWFDASNPDSFVWYDYPGVTTNYNGYPLLIGWKDAKKGIDDIYLYNRRMYNGSDTTVSQNVPQVLPYVVADGLNGLPYVSFGENSSRRLPFHSASTECTGTRAPTGGNTATFGDCPFCIMVFGSQNGGGYAILGDTAKSFARNGKTAGVPWMKNAACKLIEDGVEVNPTSDKPNGRWQILSVDMSEAAYELSCIGAEHAVTGNSSNPGGQQYAEVIFFSQKPTVAERVACERYLAEKWGLVDSYIPWDVGVAEVSGSGKLNLADDNKVHEGIDEIVVAGSFTGTINVPEGKTLVVSPRSAPPTAADLPQQDSITAWFDPSLDGAIDSNGKANGVGRLYSRTAAGVDKSEGAYWVGMQAGANVGGINSSAGRFPFLVETSYSGGFGAPPTIGWMDYERDSKDSGNTLRSHPIANLDVTTPTAVEMQYRSVFMSLDTSSGGGNPFADSVAMNAKFKPRRGWDVDDPIWSSSNTVTMAHTWLGTNEVDGTATGFSGRGEVLGFELSDDLTRPVFLGFYKGGFTSETNFEHIGETIIYNTTLTESERLTVQHYLMAKWLGDYDGVYSDLTGATVTGEGVVKSAGLRNLPQLDADFSGSLAGGSALEFTIDTAANDSAAVDALSFDLPLALDDAGTVTVSGTVPPGAYTLLTASTLTGGSDLALQMEDERFNAELAVVGNALVLNVKTLCTTIIIR